MASMNKRDVKYDIESHIRELDRKIGDANSVELVAQYFMAKSVALQALATLYANNDEGDN